MEENQKKQQNEQGMMVVEAVLSFTVFIMVVTFIVYLITIFSVHNKIQFAINSTAKELSSYTYLYEVFGLRSAEKAVDEDFNPYTEDIDNVASKVSQSLNYIQGLSSSGTELVESVQSDAENMNFAGLSENWDKLEDLSDQAGTTVESFKDVGDAVKEAFSDPKSLFIGMIYMGISGAKYEIKCLCGQYAAEAMTQKYLQQDGMTADEYLKKIGVIDGYAGLDFNGSSLFCDEDKRLIDIVVQYDLDLGFLQFIMPKDTIHVVQRVTVPAWLNGDGKTVEFETGEE